MPSYQKVGIERLQASLKADHYHFEVGESGGSVLLAIPCTSVVQPERLKLIRHLSTALFIDTRPSDALYTTS